MALKCLTLLGVGCRLNYDYLDVPSVNDGGSSSSSTGGRGDSGETASDGGSIEPSGGVASGATSGGTGEPTAGAALAGAPTLAGAASVGDAGAPSCTEADCGPVGLGSGTLVTFGYEDSDFNHVVSDTFVTSNAPAEDNENHGTFQVNSIPDTTTTLLRFDISALPAGTSITGAQLRLAVFRNPSTMGSVTIHEQLEARTEWETNWNERATGVLWTTPGCGVGSRAAVVLARFEPYAAQTYLIPLPVNVIQGWVDDPSRNFGFVLAGDGTDFVDFKPAGVGSGVRPQLSLTYQ
jgi:hypothetical protein